jgi:hypothetical protein
MSISFLFDKNPDFASAGSGSAAVGEREVFQITALAQTQSERLCRLALATGFRLLRLSGIDRIDAPAHAAGRGSVGRDG